MSKTYTTSQKIEDLANLTEEEYKRWLNDEPTGKESLDEEIPAWKELTKKIKKTIRTDKKLIELIRNERTNRNRNSKK